MLQKEIIDYYRYDAQGLAEYFSVSYYQTHEKRFPLNPFQVLTDLGIHFVLREFDKLEGLFFPATADSPIHLVAINAKRPITRQRFSAAHELCHFLKDRIQNPLVCTAYSSDQMEKYAERFAAAFLMPRDELQKQLRMRTVGGRRLECDDILYISDYFGTSFLSCYFRIKSTFPNTLHPDIEKKRKKYKPDLRRKELKLSYLNLYSDLMDAWDDIGFNYENEFAAHVFKNHYIFNDARIEGVEVQQEESSEIIDDLDYNRQKSRFCREKYDPFCHIAGHRALFQYVFDHYQDIPIDIYRLIPLNKELFSCMPHPEYGGLIRRDNVLVLGAKFETVDWRDVMKELIQLNAQVLSLDQRFAKMKRSQVILEIVKIHHKITVIHPFHDGNGRTSRGFMNLMLLRYGMLPIYIKLDNKEVYYNALEKADKSNDYNDLLECIMKELIRSHIELSKQ